MSRAVFGGLPQTFSLPPDRGTADQVIASNGDGTTMWAAGGGGGGGSGTVTSVAAGPYCVDSGTPTVAPVIGLNIIPLGTVGTNGQVLSATATANELAWIDQTAALSFTLPLVDTDNVVSLKITGNWSATNNTVQGSSATVLEWGPDAAGVTQVKTGANITDSGSATIPNLSVVVAGTYAANDVVGSLDSGVTMTWVAPPASGGVSSVAAAGTYITVAGTSDVTVALAVSPPTNDNYLLSSTAAGVLSWVEPPADGVTSVVEGNGIDVDNATPTAPVISVAVRPNSFVANNVGASVNQVDLNVGACPTAGYVLSSTVGGGSGSTVAPTLTWVDPLAGLSATAPVSLAAGVISLPIAGTWASGTNDVVKGSSASALVWGPDSSGTTYTGTAPIVVTGSVISVAEGLYLTTNASNQLDLNITNASTAGYYLTADPVAGHMQWQPPPTGSGTVTNVTATTGGYCTIGSTSTTTPSVGLNLVNAAASGQILAATGNLTLEFIDIPPATLPAVTQGPASFASATLYTVTPSLPVPVLVIDADIGVTTDPFLYTQFGNLCMIQPTFNYVVTITSLGTVPVGTTGYKLVLNSNAPLPSIGSITDPLALALSPATNPQTYLSGTWGSGAGGLGLTIQWTIGTGSPGAGSVYNGILPPISYATA